MAASPPLPSLLAFEAVARRRSFALAAAELHLTASAVSHQVARLESQLGVRLFERSAHGVRLSAAGEQYLPPAVGAARYYHPVPRGLELRIGERLAILRTCIRLAA